MVFNYIIEFLNFIENIALKLDCSYLKTENFTKNKFKNRKKEILVQISFIQGTTHPIIYLYSIIDKWDITELRIIIIGAKVSRLLTVFSKHEIYFIVFQKLGAAGWVDFEVEKSLLLAIKFSYHVKFRLITQKLDLDFIIIGPHPQ